MKKFLLSMILMIFIILLASSSLCYSQGIGRAYNFISPVSYVKSNNNLFFTEQTIEATIKIDTALKGNAKLLMGCL